MLEDYFNDKVILAIVLLLKEEINKLRTEVGLPQYTNQQVKTAFKDKLNELGRVCGTDED